MRIRLYDYIRIFILLETLQAISYAKVVSDTQRETSEVARVTSQPRRNDSYAREINPRKRRAKRSANPDIRQSNTEKSIGLDTDSNEESDYGEEETGQEEIAKREEDDKETSDLVRSPRDINVEKYADQDERSSLYDDYEAKDVAKRGVLGGPGDYEEAENDSGLLENESRVKRDREAISETPDKSEPSIPAKLQEPEVARNPFTREVSRVESSKSFNRRASDDSASQLKGTVRSNEVISRSSDFAENEIPASVITSSGKDEESRYGRRVEEEIRRKIESIKEEIKRDIEAQQRIRDIEENNVRFDELRDQEDESIEKRQIGKRSVGEIAAAASSSSEKNDEKRCLKAERRDKLQRSSDIGRSDTLKESESLKRRFAINRDKSSGQTPSMGLVKRKRERVRQTFLVNNDQARKRRSRSYTSSSDRTASRLENELFTDLNSHRYTNDGMLQGSSPVAGEDENNDGEQSPVAERSNSLASLTGSSQELSPRLAREYKEAFGGLQSESGSALARFKRIKRVLDAKS
ncbi:uncharacterized protein LOC114936750 [Nylanderia fulva]|uniref:uncharacterized protein LOC114936750 n=1 Tax=Nylanderia fulva TaxID=613905 RepID=UPI0010FB4B76|nr:uncharacterized protein LOC114936750 [Nylanderia fulva]